MRHLWLVFLFSLLSATSWCATRTAVSSGNWTTNSVWDCSCAPSASDNVVIPSGFTITITFPAIVLNNMANITVTVNGTLNLSNAGLTLDSGDQLIIGSGGQVRSSGLGGLLLSGLTPIVVSTGSPINGPAVLTGGTLPITLLYFNVSQKSGKMVIDWASATEEGFDYYVVERSGDGQKFEELTRVKGVAESREKRVYQITDDSPFLGKSYYRLVSVDLDGRKEYFDVISVEYGRTNLNVQVYPNPINTGETLTVLAGGDGGPWAITIRDLAGKVVYQANATSQLEELPNVNLSSGVYVLSVLSNSGVSNQRFEVR